MASSLALPPLWKEAIDRALTKYPKSIVIQLASCVLSPSPLPFVRSHIFRLFLSPTSNPNLPLLITTTDIRSQKISQIISNPHVELVWWIDGTQEQFRISGLARVVPAPAHHLHHHFLHHIISNAGSGSPYAALSAERFDWEQMRKDVFRSLSGCMQATWCRPLPGSPLKSYDDAKSWPDKLKEPQDNDNGKAKQDWETALQNFALVVIEPQQVDYLELAINPNRRTRFWLTDDVVWNMELVVP